LLYQRAVALLAKRGIRGAFQLSLFLVHRVSFAECRARLDRGRGRLHVYS
jgi:hypothetical protein